MPWEIGFYDGFHEERIAIFPLVENASSTFVGQEYLGVYPYIEKITDLETGIKKVGVMKAAHTYIPLRDFTLGLSTSRYGYR